MAENQVSAEKMAVSAVDHAPVSKHNDFQSAETDLDRKASVELNPKKKSCFQITRVITKSGGSDQADGDVDDDFDETNTEEVSSVSFDASKTNDTDFDQHSEDTLSAHSIPVGNEEFIRDLNKSNIPSSTPQANSLHHDASVLISNHEYSGISTNTTIDARPSAQASDVVVTSQEHAHVASQPPVQNKEKPSESRFKVVKIESKEPFRRGRWSCQDFLDPPSSDKAEKTIEELGSHGSGNSSTASSVHYIPGVDEPSRNPLADSQNGDYSTQSQSVFPNGSHIGKSSPMPSQHIPAQVPSSMTQTHMQNILPPSDMGNQYGQTSARQQQGAMINGQQAQSQQSFSQANIPPHSSSQAVQPNSVQTEKGPDYIPPQSDYIPTTPRHQNAQTTQETAISQQIQSSTSQEFNKVPQSFRTQAVDVRSSNASSESVHAAKGDYTSQDRGYAPTGGVDKQADNAEQESIDRNSSLKATNTNHPFLAQPLLAEMVSARISHSDKDDESGASTVAIDNKIEQAMDLVKSHLMYAVREEVEVLREQIKDLLEKNSQLEHENQILRQGASAETLAKIQQPRPSRGQSQAPSSTS